VRRRLYTGNRGDPVQRPIEGGDGAHTRALCASNQVGLREVQTVDLVHLDGPHQQRRVDTHDRFEAEQLSQRRHLAPCCFVERFQDVHGLPRHQVLNDVLVDHGWAVCRRGV
jgi:hypothetical protein